MKTDMSEKAIAVRLKRVAQLRRLCLSLGKARSAGKGSEYMDQKEVQKPQRRDRAEK